MEMAVCTRTGLKEGNRLIYIAFVISREEGHSKQRRAGGMLYSTLQDVNMSIS